MDKQVKVPEYWKREPFQPLIEAETAYGHKVLIPKEFTNGWETARMTKEYSEKRGEDPLDGLEVDEEINPLYYDLERVYFEIYETEE